MGYYDYEREIARMVNVDIGLERGCWLVLRGTFRYEGGGQGTTYIIDDKFIKCFMEVFDVESLQDINGKECWVTHNHENIKLIEPLFRDDGNPFDIHAWAEEIKEVEKKEE